MPHVYILRMLPWKVVVAFLVTRFLECVPTFSRCCCLPAACFGTRAHVQQVVITGDSRRRKFDHVFGADSTQEQVYRSTTLPLVNRCLEGYNATVLAYGQTGSGKTFTVGNAYTVRARAHIAHHCRGGDDV